MLQASNDGIPAIPRRTIQTNFKKSRERTPKKNSNIYQSIQAGHKLMNKKTKASRQFNDIFFCTPEEMKNNSPLYNHS